MKVISAGLCFHFLSIFILSLMITVGSSSDCNRVYTPGWNPRLQLVVEYPFGFSHNCAIPLNLTEEGRIQIGAFTVSPNWDGSIRVHIPANCSRSIQELKPLFGNNYAPTLQNVLLVQNCTSPPPSCSIPTNLFQKRCDRPYCFSKEKNDSNYMSLADLEQTSCTNVFSSVSSYGSSLESETIRLGWWLEGECNCSSNAECINITSPVNGKRSFRCSCADGFYGDGHAAGGEGCWKVQDQTGLSKKQKLVIGVSMGGVGIFTVLLLIYLKRLYTHLCTTTIYKNYPNVEEFLKSYGSHSLQRYKFADIKKMTSFFDKKVGQGGYGSVFEGKLCDGTFVAVKILNESKGDGEEFLNEVVTIGRTNHVNVVRLLGFSIEGTKRALVYEFMSNGSLEKFIYNNGSSTTSYAHLGWERLFQITQGIARGLEYLHRGCNDRILHFDIKPHNILLDHDFCPKISDFGLAKLCLTKESYVSMVGARGTVGYIAPELCCRNFGVVSHKSDVYSYGMMVLEMIGGRRNIDTTVENISEIYFPDWIYKQIQQNNVERQEESIVEESNRNLENATAKRMIIVALWCIQSHPVDRPSMSKVVEMLETNDEIPMPPNPALDPRSTVEM